MFVFNVIVGIWEEEFKYPRIYALSLHRVRDLPDGRVEEMVKANIALYVRPCRPSIHPHA